MSEAAALIAHMLRPLMDLAAPETEELCVNRPGECFVRAGGRFVCHDLPLDFDDLYDIAVLAGALRQQDVGPDRPLLAADLPDGSRLQAVLPPCVPEGTISLTIRRHSERIAPVADITRRFRTERWNRWDRRYEARAADNAEILALYDSGDIARFFHEAVRLRFNILLTGATGSGKTSFLKSLVSTIGPGERLITIENALELTIANQPNHVRLLYSHGDQGTARVAQTELLQAYLRMRPDRGFVGELRDPEAAYTYATEVCTGHPGSATTIHGKDAGEALKRLFDLIKGSAAGLHYADETILGKLSDAIDIIVPFTEQAGEFFIGEVWLKPDAERRGATVAELRHG